MELTDDVNPHDVACLLKEFFRSLPEPLMTVELFAPFLATRSECLGLLGWWVTRVQWGGLKEDADELRLWFLAYSN